MAQVHHTRFLVRLVFITIITRFFSLIRNAGTSISVYGTADNASCSMKYTIDDQSMTLTTVTVSSIARAPNTLFYAVSPLLKVALPESQRSRFDSHFLYQAAYTISRSHGRNASLPIPTGLTI
jgi:hypothetical protein